MLRPGKAPCQVSEQPGTALQMPLDPFRMAPRKSEGILQGGQCMPQVTENDLVVQTLKVVNVITDPRARSQTVRFSTYRAI